VTFVYLDLAGQNGERVIRLRLGQKSNQIIQSSTLKLQAAAESNEN
jgi:hypothetical protein